MKNIRFYTIAVLFGKLPTPKVNRCLHMDIRYSTFDIGSHVISCLRESTVTGIQRSRLSMHETPWTHYTTFYIYIPLDLLLGFLEFEGSDDKYQNHYPRYE